MISYRHHVVSLVAVFLALAVGVALGGGPLSELGRDDTPASAQTRAQAQDAQREASFGDDFATAAAAALYGERLQGQTVSVLTMPGADGDVVSGLAAQVEAAGGKVAGTYAAEPALVAASEKSLVDTLGSQLMTQLDDGTVPADVSTYDRIGQLLGVAVSGDAVSSAEATSIRQSLAGADLVTSPEDAGRAPLLLVVLGDDSADDAILSGLLSGLAATTTGVVVAGDAASGVDGDLRGLRGEPVADEVTTVDSADSAVGQVTTVLALARSLKIPGGSFGASGSDGAVPLG
ncbi:copper transporter [Nocardioides sp. MAHUQ-72]|uniref:copper transporter n=1 Tax=unclassified Nocardioides TaxID=2615069 RepID=UPI00361AA47A